MTLSEFEERAAVVYAGRTQGDLHAAISDLPVVAAAAADNAREAWRAWALTGATCLMVWIATSVGEGRAELRGHDLHVSS